MKICLIYNFAQHYRTNIFTLIDKELNCDFVFGDSYLDIKKMDYSLIQNNKVNEVKNISFGPIDYQKGVPTLIFKNYDAYIMLGEPMCLSTWLMLITSKFTKKKVYLWSHGWYGKETKTKKIIKKLFFKLADGVLLYGNYAKGLMIEEGFNPEKLKVIHNSLAYDAQLKIREQIGKTDVFKSHFKNDYYNLIFIGRLTKIKRLDLIIEALYLLDKKGQSNINLTLIGTGTEEANLKQLAKERGLEDRIWFYGACYDEKTNAELIYNADLCVSPGNVGLTSIHSMTFGCPVITHDNFPYQMPEFEAIKEGVTGNFFKQDDVESIAQCIQDWANNADREEVRKKCMEEIDNSWNPNYQLEVIKEMLKI